MFPATWKKELESNYILQVVLQVMADAHPAKFAINGDNNADVSPTRAAIELGATRGYSKYDDTLRLLAKPKPKQLDVGEPTYAEPPVEEKANA